MIDALALVVIFAPIILNVWGWRRATRLNSAELPRWQKQIALYGLGANSIAVAIPWAMFIRGFILVNYGGPTIDVRLGSVIYATLACAAISVLSGLIGPRETRIQLICSGLLAGSLWFIVPAGVL